MKQAKGLETTPPASLQKVGLAYGLILFSFVLLGLWAKNTDIVFKDLPVDYGNYIHGIQMLYQGENPYARLEFFEPPWIAFLLAPFYLLKSPVFWQIACVLFVTVLIILTYRQFTPSVSKPVLITGMVSSLILPTTIFALTLGQLSSLVGLVMVWLYMRLDDGKIFPLEVIFGLVLLTLKAHVVLLPLLIFGVELIRRRQWSILIISGATIVLLGVLSSIYLLEDWIPALTEAVLVGRKFLGGQGLAGGAHFSYANLGISSLVFIPHLIYVLVLWVRKGINQYLFLLLLTLNFLLIPYSRQYDYVLLLPAWLYILSRWVEIRQYFWALLLFLLMFFFPFYSSLHFFIPTILLGILLLLPKNPIFQSDIAA